MIKFYGFSNGKAIAVNNHKNMMNAFWISLLPALLLSPVAIAFAPIALIPVWIFPTMFLSFAYLVLLFAKRDDSEFLQGTKKRHEFRIEDGTVYKNGKAQASTEKMSLYKYGKYLLLVFSGRRGTRFYLVPDNAYTEGSREEFLSAVQFTGFHSFTFKRKGVTA